jgi:hypothetical protein
VNTGHFFEETLIQAMFYFLCFVSAVLFAFAAGTILHRPSLAHGIALACLVSAPWIYSNAITDSGLGNVWLVFNVPDNDLGAYMRPYALTTIAVVAVIALGVISAGFRLLPAQWQSEGPHCANELGLRSLQAQSFWLSGLASQCCRTGFRALLTTATIRFFKFSMLKRAGFNFTRDASVSTGNAPIVRFQSLSLEASGDCFIIGLSIMVVRYKRRRL